MPVSVLADIVGSRQLPDRAVAQQLLDEAIASVEREVGTPMVPMRPTVGDEQQAVFATLNEALAFTLLLQLSLPDGIACRFGLGVGAVRAVASAAGDIPEGPAWWAARAAINVVHTKQQRAVPSARTWIVAAPEQDGGMHDLVDFTNAYLLARDQLVGAMNERGRRLTLGRCLGRTQRELAEAEGITQPAVSQALATAGGGAVVEGYLTLRQEAQR